MSSSLKRPEYLPTLNKQIDRYFQSGITPEKMQAFLDEVNETYKWFERDKMLSEHAYSVSEKEYQEVVTNLKEQHEIIRQSIGLLKESIMRMDKNAVFPFDDTESEIVSVVMYLNKQIEIQHKLEQQLIESKEIAEKAAKAKSDFLSVMSHEIKTPLNAIIGLSHLLKQQEFTPEQSRNINALHVAAENLLSLVNDMLDYNKIEEGKIELSPQPVDLRPLLNNLKYTYELKASEKQTTVQLQIDDKLPDKLMVDEVRLSQVLHNLMSNAVKFTNEGVVSLRVMLLPGAPNEYAKVRFEVQDTGIGIHPDKQHLIFEHFTQADNNITRKYGGSGLGLSIVKRILQLMDSSIELTSTPGVGSTFSFTLTLPIPNSSEVDLQQQKAAAGKQSHDFSGLKVLIVDDLEFNVMVAEQMLTNYKATCSHAGNGQEAIDMVKNSHYDLILMDLQMPVMDGFEATKRIREFNNETPVVALTASSEPEVIKKAKVIGMDDYLMKPINPKDLYNIVDRYSRYKRV